MKMSKLLLAYQQNDLIFGGKPLQELDLVKNYRQPVMVYDLQGLSQRLKLMTSWKRLKKLHFAMKANYNLEVLKTIQQHGVGLDVVSWGEIELGFRAGFKPEDIIFSGVGKTKYELEQAIRNQIFQINVESLAELQRIDQICRNLNQSVNIGLRVNPEVDAKTHPNIATALKDSKFGLNVQDLPACLDYFKSHPLLKLKAISYHLGSQIMDQSTFAEALRKIRPLFEKLQNEFSTLDRLDLGGGLGIDYREHDLSHDEKRWQQMTGVYEEGLLGLNTDIYLEMGRFVIARFAVLIGQVQYIKKTESLPIMILDVGMNNLLRPSLYQAYHHIYSLKQKTNSQKYMIVGPICESSDVFHKSFEMMNVEQDDLVVFSDVGAYVQSMASDYNQQPKAIEVFI